MCFSEPITTAYRRVNLFLPPTTSCPLQISQACWDWEWYGISPVWHFPCCSSNIKLSSHFLCSFAWSSTGRDHRLVKLVPPTLLQTFDIHSHRADVFPDLLTQRKYYPLCIMALTLPFIPHSKKEHKDLLLEVLFMIFSTKPFCDWKFETNEFESNYSWLTRKRAIAVKVWAKIVITLWIHGIA